MLDFITWTASPNLYSGFLTVRWYGLMFAIGFLFGYEVVYRIFKHEGAPEKWVGSLFIYVVVATIVGAADIQPLCDPSQPAVGSGPHRGACGACRGPHSSGQPDES